MSADLPAFRERLRARGIMLPSPEGDGFWLRVNETLTRSSPEALAQAFWDAAPADEH